MLSAQRYPLLGVTIDALTKEQLLAAAEQAMHGKDKNLIVGNHNLHSIHLYHRLPQLRDFYSRCGLIHADGMSIIALGRLLGLPLQRKHRITYLDWIEDFLALAAARRWRIYVIGGSAELARTLPALLRDKYPALEVRCHHGYLQPGDSEKVFQEIADHHADIVMAGMGMPRQEEWILNALPQLSVRLIFNCGAAFEYLAGEKYRPPRWAGKVGLEWFFRWVSEPRRLATRYFVEPLYLLPIILRSLADRGTKATKHFVAGESL